MYIKKLVISTPTNTIREIEFKMGMNLIADDTPQSNFKTTGNNVGKTTVKQHPLGAVYYTLLFIKSTFKNQS